VAIADRTRELCAQGLKVARMQTGEPCFNTPGYIIKGAYEAMRNGYTHYSNSQGIPELRSAISHWYKEEYDALIPPENILISNGAICSIYCILGTILSPGDNVLVPEPFWPQYKHITTLSGGNIRCIETSETNGRLTPNLFERFVMPNSKVLILNNPNNPSGIVYSREEVEEFLEIAAAYSMFVLADEVYNRITYSDMFCSVFRARNYSKCKDMILYVNSFSKTFAMTGWRVGYSFLPVNLITGVLKFLQNSVTCVSAFVQYGAKTAIEGRKEHQEWFSKTQSVYMDRYTKLTEILSRKNIGFIRPEGAFYFFIDCGEDSETFAFNLLEKEKIAVVPGSAYGKGFNQYYRISFAVDQESFDRFTAWLNDW